MDSPDTNTTSTEATTVPSSGFADFILQQRHIKKLRAQITLNQIEAAAVALSAGTISAEAALLILAETGISVPSTAPAPGAVDDLKIPTSLRRTATNRASKRKLDRIALEVMDVAEGGNQLHFSFREDVR
jgi:hypothetical protein